MKQSDQHNSRTRHIVGNTLVVGACFALAALAGIVRNIVIARQFGIGADLDAYYAAFKLPDLLFTIVAGGALATAFIPVFAEFLASGDQDGAWRLASALTNLVVLVVAGLAALAALAAPWLVRVVIAPGFDAAQQAETAGLMRLVLISTLLFGISAVQGSVLNGFKHFLLPAVAPVRLSPGHHARCAVAGTTLRRARAGDGRGHRGGLAPGGQGARSAALWLSLVARSRPQEPSPAPGRLADAPACT